MKRRAALAVFLAALSWAALAAADDDGLRRLVSAYPAQFEATEKANVLRWKDGTETAYDDGVVRSGFDEKMRQGSPKDQMSIPYPCGEPVREPGTDEDPGRIRCEALFRKMYGHSAAEVERALVEVAWPAAGPSKRVRFTRVNGAADALRRAGEEVNALPDDLRRYVAKPIGTFTWRTIAGEDRPSPHSFGMAIDFQLPAPVHRYWRWDAKGGKDVPAFPREILEDARLGRIMALFERHGFICGGKWRHYDTMHFEYRPELTGGGGEVMGSMGRIEAECRAGRAGRPGLPAPACSGA